MHGIRRGEDGKRRRHMLPVPNPGTETAVAAIPLPPSVSDSRHHSAFDSFSKDGRTIRVGDCALFQAGNAPPFIGIIRWFATSKDDYLNLCVNWLYRPADIKLAKGILLEAAPNEVFYSFHKDIISAASLLHPCKVAFLCKGVELPSGISSFVCRRVYDIENKCLWWLTDQDYINERQEEVDQLLDKTRQEMHAAAHSGGRSPKQLNSPTSSQQLKAGSGSVQNSGASFPSQAKGKKRECSDQSGEPTKRERPSKTEDGDTISMIKAEIAKITEKGGLTNIEGVEKLVQLMQLDRSERKLDLVDRALLTDVISATERFDCLGRFVQLRGLPVLDDWLQEAHKGKAGDSGSPKESDRAAEELLFSLLRALDKLPVNLNALKTCNIGKSVNHLRSHKNLEVQKKAKSLVDTWKKRVDAEIKIHDSKSNGPSQAVSWPGKQGLCEISHAGKNRGGSTEASTRSSITHPSVSRSVAGKPVHADDIVKSVLTTPVSLKLPTSLSKATCLSGASDLAHLTVKEEKSSGSSHSQSNSQSCSGDHVKALGSSWKEDARSSTAGSINPTKTSGGSSRNRRSSNGFLGSSISGVHKEIYSGKSGTLSRTKTLDRSDRTQEIPVADHANSQRLTLRVPNPSSQNHVQSSGGGSFEDTSIIGSKASSPEKHGSNDRKIKTKADAITELCQSNGIKEEVAGSDLDDGLPAAVVGEEHSKDANITNPGNVVGVVSEAKTRNSFSSMNALVESCAKYSEATVPLSSGDDIGMNLLASVAAGEISKPDLVTPNGSPASSPAQGGPCAGSHEVKSRLLRDDGEAQSLGQFDEKAAEFDSEKHEKGVDPMQAVVTDFYVDNKSITHSQENELTREQPIEPHGSIMNSHGNSDSCLKSEGKLEEKRAEKTANRGSSPCTLADTKEEPDSGGASQTEDKRKCDGQFSESITHFNPKERNPLMDENTPSDCAPERSGESNKNLSEENAALGKKMEEDVITGLLSCPFNNELPSDATSTEHQPSHAAEGHSENVEGRGIDAGASSVADKVLCSEGPNSNIQNPDKKKKELASVANSTVDEQAGSVVPSINTTNEVEEIEKGKDDLENHLAESAKVELASLSGDASLHIASEHDTATMLDFDLNEGISGDDWCQNDQTTPKPLASSSAFHAPNLPAFTSSPVPNGSPAPITVAAPAKGPFFHPENLSKSKSEPGWKGSAATSAFRPAEPRKIPEKLLSTSDAPSSDITVKHGKPLLDFDLNMPYERILEDMVESQSSESGVIGNRDAPERSGGGLDLDLNRVDESIENAQALAMRPTPGGFPVGEANLFKVFDSYNGRVDEVGVESQLRNQQHTERNISMPFLPPGAGFRINNPEFSSVSSWLPPGNTYPAVAIPSFMPDRGDPSYPQRILGSIPGADIYRGAVLASSPAMPFAPATVFPYAGFPYGSSFPVASTSFTSVPTNYTDSSSGGFPPVPSHFVGPAGAISSHYPRPYMFGLAEGSSSSSSRPESSRAWGRQSLDLNAGPGGAEMEVKDDRFPSSATRQLSIAGSQAFAEEQARMYHAGLKRKEPDGGRDVERFAYKQHPWQ